MRYRVRREVWRDEDSVQSKIGYTYNVPLQVRFYSPR